MDFIACHYISGYVIILNLSDTLYLDNIFFKVENKLTKSPRALYVYFSAPKTVTSPKVSRVGGGRVFLKLSSASEIFGPLSHYELVVVPEENATKGPQDFTLEEVKPLGHFNIFR